MTVARLRRRAAWGIWVATLSRALAPAAGILAAYLILALFGLPSPWVFSAALLLAAAAFAFGITRVRRPVGDEIDRRIEQASGLRHRPIAVLEDAPENESELSAVLWQLHQRRAAASLQSARAGRPAIDASIHDPYALRGLLVLLLLVAGIIAGPGGLQRVAGAFAFPSWPFAGPGVNAWVTLPSYTGAPPLLLLPGDHPMVLAGSRLTVVVNGEHSRPPASFGTSAIRFTGSAQDGFRADTILDSSGKLRIGPWWHRLAVWNFTVLPPEKPLLQMSQPLPAGHLLLIGWHAQDRYGLVSLTATLAPLGHPDAMAEILDLPLDGQNSKNAGGVAKPAIGDSPYAGLQVTVLLAARNLAGVTGFAGPMTVRLPPPDLADKTAAALAQLRQRLALAPTALQPAGEALQKLAQAPPSHISSAADLQLAVLSRQLTAHEISATAALERMGSLARQIEEGPDYQPAQALAAANQALEQALRQAITGKKLDNARLQSLLAAMHAALAQHLQALGPSSAAANPKTIGINGLDQMAEQIAQDEASGHSAKAAAELNRLQQILAALQSAKPMSAQQARRAQTAEQAAQDLSKLTQGESTLLDQTNQGEGQAKAQMQLQKQLAATKQNLAGAGISLPGLGDAGTAMDAAKAALTRQDTGIAANAEGGAIQALQKAQAALAAASQGMSFGEGATAGAGEEEDGEGLNGAPDEQSVPGILPSGDDPAKIQQEIIKNDDNPALPSAVHQYYHRLLNQDGP